MLMSRRLLCLMGGVLLSLATAGLAFAQQTPTTTTTTTVQTPTTTTSVTAQTPATTTTSQTPSTQTAKQTTVVQNPDGSWTVIEYPVGQEVTVDLTPSATSPNAKGRARVLRSGDATTVHLDLTGLNNDVSNLNLYAVDPMGKVTLLGPVTATNGTATFTTTTPLNKFMLVLSPEANLSNIGPNTNVLFRSAVPQGFAVVPYAHGGERDGAAIGERVAATSTANPMPAYNVPMLGIPGFRRGTDTEMKINFTGPLTGSRANVYIEPRRDGPTTIKMRFHELKDAPAGKVFAVWAVSPDGKFVRLGQIVNTGQRNEAQIQTETALPDFGLLVTMEDEFSSPHGDIIGTISR